MLKALLWKEFREQLPLSVVMLLAQLILISAGVAQWRYYQLQGRPGSAGNSTSAVWPLLYLVAFLFPICVGLWQNFRESNHNTFQLLLQRPARRETLFGAKLLFGFIAVLVSLIPFLCYTLWLDRPRHPGKGTHALGYFCGLAAGIGLLYLGAFLSSLRPARWYGSRFYPLFAALLLFYLLQLSFVALMERLELRALLGSDELPALSPFVMLLLAFGLLPIVGLISAIFYVGLTRDYS